MLDIRTAAAAFAAATLLIAPAAAQDHGHGASQAHGQHDTEGLAGSSPADGEIVTGAPSSIVLDFDHPMTVRSVQLLTDAMERIAIDFEPSEDAVERVEIALDEDLEPGGYQVTWRAAADDHEMSGSVTFAVR